MTTTVEPIPRTQDAIADRLAELSKQHSFDPHGIERSRLLEALEYSRAERWLRDDAEKDPEQWEKTRPKTRADIFAQIVEYMPLAWDKANKNRGTSAERTLAHCKGLVWLLGPEHEELVDWIDASYHNSETDPGSQDFRHPYFGKPALVRICELVGYDWHPKRDGDGDLLPGRDNGNWFEYTRDAEGDFILAPARTANEVLGR